MSKKYKDDHHQSLLSNIIEVYKDFHAIIVSNFSCNKYLMIAIISFLLLSLVLPRYCCMVSSISYICMKNHAASYVYFTFISRILLVYAWYGIIIKIIIYLCNRHYYYIFSTNIVASYTYIFFILVLIAFSLPFS